MKRESLQSEKPRKLNVGCGANFHEGWCNIDLVASDPRVLQYDIRRGLPFDDNSFDVVYHSHVLEHLTPQQGRDLLAECHRVLKPEGILRIVVPDLERIAQLYLEMLQKAWMGDPRAAENYQWMKLELLDQMVRDRSGGMMGPYMIDQDKENREFVASRIGRELDSCQSRRENRLITDQGPVRAISAWFEKCRERMATMAVHLLLGKDKSTAFKEGLFRHQGEIHRWMYDRYSLLELCSELGFEDFRICLADESLIDNFASFHLDTMNDQVRKPDSLFVECCKRRMTLRAAA
ncbi:MAG: class I SAM-dependent methyltransferase [Pirellulaceae bacterium]